MRDQEEQDVYPPPQETWREFFAAIGRAVLLALAVALVMTGASFITGCDLEAAQATAAHEAEARARHALPPEEIAYWRRHERHKSGCRGQAYVAQCCDSSFNAYDVTCLNPEDIR